MKLGITTLISLVLTMAAFGQLPKKVGKRMGPHPVVFLDSIETDLRSLQSLNPMEISNISIVTPKKSKKLLGEKGTDGAIYVTTVKLAKRIYWSFFRGKSEAYKKLLDSPQADTIVQYVLNGEPLSDSAAPGSLFLRTDRNFKSIEVIDKETLPSDNLRPKRYVVAIKARHPKGLLKASKSN